MIGGSLRFKLVTRASKKARRDFWTRKQTSPTRTPRRTGRTAVQYGGREPVPRALPRRAKVKIFAPVPGAREVTGTGQHSLCGSGK